MEIEFRTFKIDISRFFIIQSDNEEGVEWESGKFQNSLKNKKTDTQSVHRFFFSVILN